MSQVTEEEVRAAVIDVRRLRSAIVAEGLSWEHTPFADMQRVKGPAGGVDCVMMVWAVGVAAAGLEVSSEVLEAHYPYRQAADRRKLVLVLDQCLARIPGLREPTIPGSVLCFVHRSPTDGIRRPQHVGIVTRPGWLVHPMTGGKVVHQPLPQGSNICGVWDFPAVARLADARAPAGTLNKISESADG